jgi:hypothetical protein
LSGKHKIPETSPEEFVGMVEAGLPKGAPYLYILRISQCKTFQNIIDPVRLLFFVIVIIVINDNEGSDVIVKPGLLTKL